MTSRPAYEELTADELMQMTLKDDLRAFEALYERLAPVALGIAGRICRSADRAEDAVQESFLSVWRERACYDPARGAARTWVFQIVRFRAIDSVRLYSRDDARREYVDAVDESISEPDDLQLAIEAADEAARLREALATLPEQQGQVIERAFFGGLSQSEIARELDLPLGTVKGRMRLGYNRLRRRVAA